jgi:hypothetical protein
VRRWRSTTPLLSQARWIRSENAWPLAHHLGAHRRMMRTE